MLRRFLPREEDFFTLFERHAALTVEGASAVRDARVRRPERHGARRPASRRSSTRPTSSRTRASSACTRRFITPIDRDDIHRLITRMDDVMDFVESASERIALYELREMTPGRARARRRAGARDRDAWRRRSAGCATSSRRRRSSTPASRSTASRTRATRSSATPSRRSSAKRRDPLLVMKWKEVYEALENATDRCEDVANIIEGVVLEHA